MSEPATPPPTDHVPLPGRPTPTWEMELLLSGATVFSLLKAPRLLDDVYFDLVPSLSTDYAGLATTLFLYLMTACLALIATFILHLCVRGYWVALVGLHSVYPGGVQWQRLRWGPGFTSALRRRTRPLEEVIETYDNRASQVFGFGIGLTVLALSLMLLFAAITAIAIGLHELSGHAIRFNLILFVLLGVTFIPYLLLYGVDSLLRKHPEGHPRLHRWVETGFVRVLRIPFLSGTNYPLLMFASHAGGRHANLLLTLALMLLIAVSSVHLLGESRVLRLHGQGPIAGIDVSGFTLDPKRYADQRRPGTHRVPAAHIPSERIHGDWLRLFIPLGERDTAALRRLCPVLDQGDAEPGILPACLGLRFKLKIDGEDLAPGADFALGKDPELDHRGVVAMIDIRTLARGRHELALELGDVPDAEEKASRRAADKPIRIPFWH